MKNRIAKLVKIGKIEIFEEEVPKLKENEILVAIKSVGICGSDMHYFLDGGLGSFKQPLPMQIGHEPSGEIVEIYDSSSEFRIGDRVAIEPGRPCLECRWCLKGKHNLCERSQFMGANYQGAFADYIIVHKTQLAKIPKTMTYNLAALMEPLGVAMHSVNLVRPKHTSSVTIVGAGSIGLCLLKVLNKMGMHDVFMIDKLNYRVDFAKKMGAKRAFHFENAVEEIKKITNKTGTEYVFDTGGTEESINACIDIVGMSGVIGLIGIPTDDYIRYNPHKLRTKEVIMQNVRRSNQTLEDCIKMFDRDKTAEKIITHQFELEDIQKAFDMVGKYSGNVIKCMITNSKS